MCLCVVRGAYMQHAYTHNHIHPHTPTSIQKFTHIIPRAPTTNSFTISQPPTRKNKHNHSGSRRLPKASTTDCSTNIKTNTTTAVRLVFQWYHLRGRAGVGRAGGGAEGDTLHHGWGYVRVFISAYVCVCASSSIGPISLHSFY